MVKLLLCKNDIFKRLAFKRLAFKIPNSVWEITYESEEKYRTYRGFKMQVSGGLKKKRLQSVHTKHCPRASHCQRSSFVTHIGKDKIETGG